MIMVEYDPSIMTVLFQYGATGIILFWFMFRTEKKLDRVAEAVENFTEELIKK